MIHDKLLEKKLLEYLKKLERLNDEVGPTPLRHKLSEKIVEMRMAIRNFDQEAYDKGEHPWIARKKNGI